MTQTAAACRRFAVGAILLAIVAVGSGNLLTSAQEAGAGVLRFHHLHVSVDDPAWHMNRAAARLDATRTILQGHGVGVRKAGQYLIFDRDRGTDPRSGADAAAIYREAAEWLEAHGALVESTEFSTAAVAGEIPGRAVAVAFSAPDLPAAVDRLQRRGVQPLEGTGETARYRLPSGVQLEIVVETDRPDDHWCPMHPDVRSAGPSRCALCGMDLVPIPPPRIGEYRLDVTVRPGAAGGAAGLHMAVRDPASGEIVTAFLDVHEQPFHLFIISRDLEQFLHVHPELHADGSITLEQSLAPGQYALIGDFLPAAGTPQMVQRIVVTPGFDGRLFASAPALRPGAREQIVDGLRVRLVAESLAPLRAADLRFELGEADTGQPVRDLQPYLGAAGHLLIVNPDLSATIHGHPEGEPTGGPVIAFDPVLPAPGPYKLWVQFQRRGRVATVPFVIEVPSW